MSKGSNRKLAIKKLTTRLKNKTWTNPQIKNHKRLDHRQNTKSRTHVFKILNTLIPSVVKTVNLCGFR
jgi:hypothetical protein